MPLVGMVAAPPLCKRCYKLWRRRVVPPGRNIGDPDRKLRRRRLVAGEETRSGRRGQHLRSDAGGPRSERYGMEPGVPHLLCFLAARIAQPRDRLEREPVRLKGWRSRFHARVCKIADRLAEYTSISSSKFVGQDRDYWLPLACEEGGRTARLIWPSLWGALFLGPLAWGRYVLGARE
jgi:hypothetical protein